MIEFRDVRVGYGETPVLDDVSVRVERGAFAGIAGPNGSGKTTLLKLVARLHAPAAGCVSIDGRDVATLARRELARLVAGVWQRPALSFGFTARELVLLGRTPYLSLLRWETSQDEAIADAAMEETHTAHLSSRVASTLSAGELQRIFIAAALAQKSRVLLLDEPTSFLDRRQAALLSALLRRLTESGVTILCASHDVALLRRHATTVLMLEDRRASVTDASALEDWYV